LIARAADARVERLLEHGRWLNSSVEISRLMNSFGSKLARSSSEGTALADNGGTGGVEATAAGEAGGEAGGRTLGATLSCPGARCARCVLEAFAQVLVAVALATLAVWLRLGGAGENMAFRVAGQNCPSWVTRGEGGTSVPAV